MMHNFLIISLLIIYFSCTTSKSITSSENSNNKETINEKDSLEKKIDDYFEEDYNVLNTKIYWESIKTLMAVKRNWELSEGVMALNTSDTLIFSFDDLTSDLENYQYTIVHCNADWTPSDLQPIEYLNGYFQDYIRTFNYSFNTLQPYIHYEVSIPNSNIVPTKSGNYIFKVFNQGIDDIVLTKRFIIYENIISTEAKVVRPTILDNRDEKQEIDFQLDIGNLVINDMFNDLKVTIQQNGRWDNMITNLKPRFIRGSIINYDYNEENVFDGNNEYRFLNIKTLRYRGDKVESILINERKNYVHLFKEERRTYKNYLNYGDLNGGYIIRNQNGVDGRVEADYAYVTFSIDAPEDIDGDIYVIGDISNNHINDLFKLSYNTSNQAFEGTFYLKQGYYDYYFGLVKNKKVSIPFFEGNHFETTNNYNIITYLRDRQYDYDRVIGYFSFLSNQ